MTTAQLVEKFNSNVAQTRKGNFLNRQSYVNVLPADAQVYANEDGVVIYKYVSRKGDLALMAFTGRSNKPCIHKAYFNEEQRKQAFGNIIENVRSRIIQTEERKAQQNRPSELEVDDILYTSWGYEQTNVEFYKVTKVIGKRTVEIQEIGQQLESEKGLSPMAGYVIPCKNVVIGKPERHVVINGTTVSFSSYRSAYKYEGGKKYCSWYA